MIIMQFDAKQKIEEICNWLKYYADRNCKNNPKFVIPFEGTTTEIVTALLFTKVFGNDNVICLSEVLCEPLIMSCDFVLGINFESRYSHITTLDQMKDNLTDNDKDRAVMLKIRSYADKNGCQVVNVLNLCENWVGCGVKGGSAGGDLAPVADLTVSEVCAIAKELNVPDAFISYESTKVEKVLGKHTTAAVETYIRDRDNITTLGTELIKRIEDVHYANIHKLKLMPKFSYRPDRVEEKKQ